MNPVIDGRLFRTMVLEAAYEINQNKQTLNDLNVFPVPDGDTGTNMGLTITAAAKALEARDASLTLTEAADTTAMALLRGARGNSGVILSLLFRGIAKALKGAATCDGVGLAAALVSASETAYRAVMKPTEGTILTVARVSAEAAREAAEAVTNDAVEILKKTCEAARKALAQTTTMNPVLARAGVVDAGGAGWVYVLNAMLHIAEGLPLHTLSDASSAPVAASENKPQTAQTAQTAQAVFSTDEIKFAYCTEFIVNRAADKAPSLLRGFLEGIGDCVVVVDDEEIIKVHVHTNHPGQAIEEALTFGSLDSLKIENMRIQHSEKLFSDEKVPHSDDLPAPVIPAAPTEPVEQLPAAFVAVVSGEGLASVFRDLGVQELVEGGQTMNPSTIDICDAAEKAPSDVVFILPNNKNIIMAAQQAAPLTEKTLIVLPTVSIPQGISAMLAYDAEADAETNRQAMEAAFANTHTAMLTYAARDSVLDDREIQAGDYLSLLDGKLISTASQERDALEQLAEAAKKFEGISYISVFYGADMQEADADNAAGILEKVFPDAEISVISGGQPIYYYIISLE